MTERVRSRNDDGPLIRWDKQAHITEETCESPNSPEDHIDTSGTFLAHQENTQMTDIVTPQYKRISGNGGIVNNPMTKVTTILRDHLCSYKYLYAWNYHCPSGGHGDHLFSTAYVGNFPSSNYLSWDDLPTIPDISLQYLIDKAVNKAWSNIEVAEVQSLVMLGESEKTVYSLCSIFRRLIRIIKAIKKAEVWYLKRQIKHEELQQRYMELRYALRPLMYDVKGITAALQTKASDRPLRVTFRGAAQDDDRTSSIDVTPVLYHNFVGDWTYDVTIEKVAVTDVIVRSGVLTAMENIHALDVWGTTQPIESVWELIPLSFIIDWFFTVGDTIAAFTPNFGVKTLSSWYTVERQDYQFIGLTHDNCETDDQASSYSPAGYSRQTSGIWLDKTVISKTRVPDPTRRLLPLYNLRINPFKLTDLVIIAKKLWR
jgi:hypothetical protein